MARENPSLGEHLFRGKPSPEIEKAIMIVPFSMDETSQEKEKSHNGSPQHDDASGDQGASAERQETETANPSKASADLQQPTEKKNDGTHSVTYTGTELAALAAARRRKVDFLMRYLENMCLEGTTILPGVHAVSRSPELPSYSDAEAKRLREAIRRIMA